LASGEGNLWGLISGQGLWSYGWFYTKALKISNISWGEKLQGTV
jgi:hypothetical protein